MQLLPFHNICAACGEKTTITDRYCIARCRVEAPGIVEKYEALGEPVHPHLHRTCKCGYEWLEQCIGLDPNLPQES